jgi:molecular chaperone GrpE
MTDQDKNTSGARFPDREGALGGTGDDDRQPGLDPGLTGDAARDAGPAAMPGGPRDAGPAAVPGGPGIGPGGGPDAGPGARPAGPEDVGPGAIPRGREAEAGGEPAGGEPGGGAETWEATEVAERISALEERWLRAAAELDNLRKRVSRDVDRHRAQERARVAAEWLPVVDHLDLALQHSDAGTEAMVAGIRAVRDQAVAVLDRLGYTRHEETGVPFDPNLHDAVSAVPGVDAAPGTIVEVVRPGYGEGDRQLRPAMVIVAANAERHPGDADDGGGSAGGKAG